MCLAITLLIVHWDWLINLCLCISHVLICFLLTGWPRLLTTRRLPTKKSVVTHNAVRRPFPTEAGEMAAVMVTFLGRSDKCAPVQACGRAEHVMAGYCILGSAF